MPGRSALVHLAACLPGAAGRQAGALSSVPSLGPQAGRTVLLDLSEGTHELETFLGSSLETEADDTARLPHTTPKISSVKISRSNTMIKDPCLCSDSNLLPVLQFLPSMSRHKDSDRLGWLPRRQERQPGLVVQPQPRSAPHSTGMPHRSLGPMLSSGTERCL